MSCRRRRSYSIPFHSVPLPAWPMTIGERAGGRATLWQAKARLEPRAAVCFDYLPGVMMFMIAVCAPARRPLGALLSARRKLKRKLFALGRALSAGGPFAPLAKIAAKCTLVRLSVASELLGLGGKRARVLHGKKRSQHLDNDD